LPCENILIKPISKNAADCIVIAALRTEKIDNECGNVAKGNVFRVDTRNCIIMGENRLVVVVGVENLVVVDTEDVVFVCAKDKVQNMKDILSQLKEEGKYV